VWESGYERIGVHYANPVISWQDAHGRPALRACAW